MKTWNCPYCNAVLYQSILSDSDFEKLKKNHLNYKSPITLVNPIHPKSGNQ